MRNQSQSKKNQSSGRGGARPGAGRKSNATRQIESGFIASYFTRNLQDSTWKSLVTSTDENVRLKAATYLTNRLYGMPIQQTELSGPGGSAIPMEILCDIGDEA